MQPAVQQTAVPVVPVPVLAYHGTRVGIDFDQFSVDGPVWLEAEYPGEEILADSGSGADPTAYLGAHFAREPETANLFAMGQGWTSCRYQHPTAAPVGPRVIPVLLQLANPRVFTTEAEVYRFIYTQDLGSSDYVNLLAEDHAGGPDAFWARYDADLEFRRQANQQAVAMCANAEGENATEVARDLGWTAREALLAQAHDGIVYKNDTEGGTSYVAFSPEQIRPLYGP